MTLSSNPDRQPRNQDPELQRMLTEAITLGQGFTAQVYEEHKHRLIRGEPPESYFRTEDKLRVAYAGKAALGLAQRTGYEYLKIETPPTVCWLENCELTVRHHSKQDKHDTQEIVTRYYVQRLESSILGLTTNTENISDLNTLRQTEQELLDSHSEDPELQLEIAYLSMAEYSAKRHQARRDEEALGLHNAGRAEAQDLLTLLREGDLQ